MISSKLTHVSNQTFTKIIDVLKIAQINTVPLDDEITVTIKNLYHSRNFEGLFLLLGDLEKFPCFLILREEMDDITYFRLLGNALTSECYAGEFPDFTRALLTERPLSSRHHLMDVSEQVYLAGLPSEITIYRGVCPAAQKGFSWTLDKERAQRFANRYLDLGGDAGILAGTCKKENVIAYFSREEEVFIDPKDVQKCALIQLLSGNRKVKEVSPKHVAYLKIKKHLTLIDVLPLSSKNANGSAWPHALHDPSLIPL